MGDSLRSGMAEHLVQCDLSLLRLRKMFELPVNGSCIQSLQSFNLLASEDVNFAQRYCPLTFVLIKAITKSLV